MKTFRFRFASVQKVRRIEMDLQARVLAEAMQELNRIEEKIAALREDYRLEVARLTQEASDRDFSEIHMGSHVHFRDELMRQERRALSEREAARQRIEEERKKLIERERRKKVFDKLEERDREIYEKESRKSEQDEMDEVAARCRGIGFGPQSADS